MHAESSGPQPDQFVDRVVADPAQPPRVTVLRGFVGRSDAPEHLRVYADETLSAWVDVPREAVRHAESLAGSPLGGSVLWVDFEAKLIPGPDRTGSAAFLRGPVEARLTASFAHGADVAAASDEGRLSTYYPECPPSVYPACRIA